MTEAQRQEITSNMGALESKIGDAIEDFGERRDTYRRWFFSALVGALAFSALATVAGAFDALLTPGPEAVSSAVEKAGGVVTPGGTSALEAGLRWARVLTIATVVLGALSAACILLDRWFSLGARWAYFENVTSDFCGLSDRLDLMSVTGETQQAIAEEYLALSQSVEPNKPALGLGSGQNAVQELQQAVRGQVRTSKRSGRNTGQ